MESAQLVPPHVMLSSDTPEDAPAQQRLAVPQSVDTEVGMPSRFATTAEFTPDGAVGFGNSQFLGDWMGTANSQLQIPTLIWETTRNTLCETSTSDESVERKLIAEMVTAVHLQEAILPPAQRNQAACLGLRIKQQIFQLYLAGRDVDNRMHIWRLAEVDAIATPFLFLCMCVRVALLARRQAELFIEVLVGDGRFVERQRITEEFQARGFEMREHHEKAAIPSSTSASLSSGTNVVKKRKTFTTDSTDSTGNAESDDNDDQSHGTTRKRSQSSHGVVPSSILELAVAAIAVPMQLRGDARVTLLAQSHRSVVGYCLSRLHSSVIVKCAPSHRIMRELQFWQRFLAVAPPTKPVLLYHVQHLPGAQQYGCLVTRQMAHAFPASYESLREFAIQFLQQVRALKTAGIVHRDLKPANVMMDYDDLFIQLIDFDLAVDASFNTPNCGTEGFVAPDKLCSYASDVYSAGRTLLHWLVTMYGRGTISEPVDLDKLSWMLPAAADRVFEGVLRAMLQPSANDRCTVEEALQMLCA
eukprot:TRINITY_DN5604_c0_g1_i1.p1 TRINITY_DN5604_c0_g1~~TRINITY_DN5604_c0_g1_i1.p1  ORF type:complete len:529 (-),score=114.16 TRINITY_DN5604_c0_g1_i1:20-1606(-)